MSLPHVDAIPPLFDSNVMEAKMVDATAAVKGGMFPENGVNTLSQISTTSTARRKASQQFAKQGMLPLREIAETLNGAAAGGAALKQRTRIANSTELGGARTIETVDLVNRATTAADEATIDADILSLSSKTYDPTPVANGDGNPLGTR